MIEKQMKHLNSNILCAVYTELTGNNPHQQEIAEICIMVLDNFIRPSDRIMPFYFALQPQKPDNIDFETATLSKARLAEVVLTGINTWTAADRLEEWFHLLDLPPGKGIVPLTHNWPFQRQFVQNWLGYENFKYLFSEQYRDLMTMALLINDRDNQRAELCTFPKVTLDYIGNELSVRCHSRSDLLEKCFKISQIYRQVLGVRI